MIYRKLTDRALTRSHHTFWHAIATQRTTNLAADFADSVPSTKSVDWIECGHLPTLVSGDLDRDKLRFDADLVVLAEVDQFLQVRHGEALLRQLRPVCNEYLDAGGRLLVISSAPRRCFPSIDGSSIVLDATSIRLDPLEEEVVTQLLEPFDFSRRSSDRIRKAAKGLAGVLSNLLDLAHQDDDGKWIAPTQPTCDQVLVDVVSNAVSDFGDVALGAIVAVRDTQGREFSSSFLDDETLRLLRNSGLARINYATDNVLLFPGFNDQSVGQILSLAEMRCLQSDGWSKVATDLFYIERAVRLLVWSRRSSDRDWLVAHDEDIKNSWREDYAREVPPVADFPVSPLSYTYLSQIIDAAADLAAGKNFGSLASGDFRQMKSALLSIRNRIGHMRLPRPDDADTVAHWKRRIERALKDGASG
jgi:hypothetical protein